MSEVLEELHEECGVFGVCHVEDAASLSYYGLHALQHRGQAVVLHRWIMAFYKRIKAKDWSVKYSIHLSWVS